MRSIMTKHAISLANNCQKTEGRVLCLNKISAQHLIQAVRLIQCDAFSVSVILKFKNYNHRRDVHLKFTWELKSIGSASLPSDIRGRTFNIKRDLLKTEEIHVTTNKVTNKNKRKKSHKFVKHNFFMLLAQPCL